MTRMSHSPPSTRRSRLVEQRGAPSGPANTLAVEPLARNLLNHSPGVGFFLALIFLMGCVGCFVPAPIEEEAPFEDEPPSFELDELTPNRFEVVNFNLEGTELKVFGIKEVLDVDPEQTLYWRALIDLDDQVRLLKDAAIPPSARRVQFELNPCSNTSLRLLLITELLLDEEVTYNLFIGVSDQPFALSGGTSDTIEQLLKTQDFPDRDVPFAQWTLRFKAPEGIEPCSL